MPRFAFLGTPAFAADLAAWLVDEKLGELAACWTRAPRPKGRGRENEPTAVERLCLDRGIPCRHPEKFDTAEESAFLKSLEVDFALVVAYGVLLRPAFFEIPKGGTFNLHFSLLPRWRGASPVPAAILAGDAETGVSLQRIDAGLDTGHLAASRSFPLGGLSSPRVFEIALAESRFLLADFFRRWPDSTANLVPQAHEKATLCGKIRKEDGRLLPTTPVAEAVRKILAYDPWPGTFVIAGGKTFKIAKASAREGRGDGNVRLEKIGKKEIRLVLADGALAVERIQAEGKKEMAAADFANGLPEGWSAPIE